MKHTLRAHFNLGLICGALVSAVSCGGSTPSTPTPAPAPPATVQSITMTTWTDMLKVKDTMSFAANAAHSDGTVVTVADWASDTPAAATVDGAGKVTGVAAGAANIIAKHDGMWGVKLVRVVPNYEGRWDGDYSITSCTETGNFTGFCKDFSVDRTLPATAIYTQARDLVDGTFSLGQVTGAARGPISQGGVLSPADVTLQSGSFKIVVSMANFTIDGSDRMQGTFRATWTTTLFAGEGRFDGRLRVMVRTSPSTAASTTRFLNAGSLGAMVAAVVTR